MELIEEGPKRTLTSKLIIIFSGLFLIAIISAVLVYAYYLNEINAPIKFASSGKIKLVIEKGMGVSQVGEYLKEHELIKFPLMLKAYMYLNPRKEIQAGYYEIETKDLTFSKLIDIFQKGSFERKLTFIEGWRTEEYKDYLEKQMGFDFADKFSKSAYIKEGYMFPDTYIVDKSYDPGNLASWMRNTFDKKVSEELFAKANLRGLSKDEVMIVASILEREMNIHEQRPKVAGILIKRWKSNWAIQADATVQYAKGYSGNWWPKVMREDLKNIKSPYNSYLNKALPPSPICNPSLNSVEAVVNYMETPYWFYITGTDGVTRYAETLEEHNENVAKHL